MKNQDLAIEQIIKDIEKHGIVDAMGDGISIQDTSYKILYENKVHIDLIGDYVGKYCYEAYQGKDNICEGCPLTMTFNDGGNHTIENSALIDNEIRYFEITASPLKDSSGKIIAGIEIVREITDRKNSMEQMRESEKKYHKLYSSMTEGVCIHEIIYNDFNKAVDYMILDVNPAYELLTNLKIERAVGSKASELYGTGEPPFLKIYSKVADTGESNYFETYFSPMEKHFSISVFSPGKGQFATVFEDITERKKSEEHLRQQALSLEQKNIALKEIIEQIDIEKKRTKNDISSNIENVLLPIVSKIEMNETLIKYKEMLKYHLNELASSYGHKISKKTYRLSLKEIEICNMMKSGLTSKEIGEMMHISSQTVDKHRRNIRKKLGLTNEKVNLASYLQQL